MKRIITVSALLRTLSLRWRLAPISRVARHGHFLGGKSTRRTHAKKHKAWSVDLELRTSSPIIIGDKLFLTASKNSNQNKLHVLCFDASSGAKHWERTVRATGRTMCHEKTCVRRPPLPMGNVSLPSTPPTILWPMISMVASNGFEASPRLPQCQ